MSIYVLRAGNIVKIGMSDDLPKRVREIITSTPMQVEFVGHMPGDRQVEQHLHARFDASRFSGEWFVETDEMRAVWAALLVPHIPRIEKPKDSKRKSSDEEVASTKIKIRRAAALRWPQAGHGERIAMLAGFLGWNPNRLKDFYYGDKRAVLRSFEADALDALWIAPELEDDTTQSKED